MSLYPLTEGVNEATERGRQNGAYFKSQGIDYGKVHGRYPSNPYHQSDPRCAEYDAAYEEGFNGH